MLNRLPVLLRNPKFESTLVTITIFLTQFIHIPSIAETGKIGTLYVLALISLLFGCSFFCLASRMALSATHCWTLFACLLMVATSLQAFVPCWALLMVGLASLYLIIFFLLTNVAKFNKQFTTIFLSAFLSFGLLAALFGLYEYVHFQFFGSSRIPLIPYLLPPDVESRVSGIYGQSNLFALFLTLTLLAFFYYYLHYPLKNRRWGNTFRFCPVVTVALVLPLTQSRGSLVSLSLIVGFIVWLVVSKRYLDDAPSARREFYLLLVSVLVGFLLSQGMQMMVSFIADSQIQPKVDFSLPFDESSQSTAGRFVFWTSAILIFLEHPWFGVGLDNYRFLMNGYGPTSHDILGFVEYEAMRSSFWAHNEFLQLLCEGGIFLFCLVLFFFFVFLRKCWLHFVQGPRIDQPLFLYSHIFIMPFLIQAQLSWPLRHPALLLLFVTFLGILVAQYPLRVVVLSKSIKTFAVMSLLSGLLMTCVLFYQERKIVAFKEVFLSQPLETTIDRFALLAENPYSSYRVMRNTMSHYTNAALINDDDSLAQKILPYSEELVRLEGAGGQWYDLARLYLRVGQLENARSAIYQAFELMPTNTVIFDFLHYLNIIRASQKTGRPMAEFFPQGIKPPNSSIMEFKHD